MDKNTCRELGHFIDAALFEQMYCVNCGEVTPVYDSVDETDCETHGHKFEAELEPKYVETDELLIGGEIVEVPSKRTVYEKTGAYVCKYCDERVNAETVDKLTTENNDRATISINRAD